MMDLQENRSESKNKDGEIKSCSDCHTTRTPLWRGGPAGPKSLCNACGIKYNKKRRQVLGLDRERKQKKSSNKKSRRRPSSSVKMRLVALGREMGLKISTSENLDEEDEAAIVLMALSCGSMMKCPNY